MVGVGLRLLRIETEMRKMNLVTKIKLVVNLVDQNRGVMSPRSDTFSLKFSSKDDSARKHRV
jgi:hypothetical protein